MADDKSKSISRAVKRTELKVIHMYLGGSAENQAPVGRSGGTPLRSFPQVARYDCPAGASHQEPN